MLCFNRLIVEIRYRSLGQVLLLSGLVMPAAGIASLATAQQPEISQPQYEVRLEKSVLVHMRDGVRLSTDLYFPIGAPEPLPVIAIRLPYNKNGFQDPPSLAHEFAKRGFVVAIQDMRGRFESEGHYIVGRANRDDGYDFISWLAEQPWSNGKIGTYGCSYLGENQLQIAATRHPNHAAAIPQAAGGGYDGTYRTFAFMDGGAIELASALGWFHSAGSKTFNRPPPESSDSAYREMVQDMQTRPPLPQVDLQESFWQLPIIGIVRGNGITSSDYEDFVSHIPGDRYWKSLNYVDDADRFDVPALHVNSWYDGAVNETLALFNLMSRNAVSARGRDNQFAIISPTAHCLSESAREHTVVGRRDMGDARFPYYQTYIRWFDYWLKGIDNGVTDIPKLQYYLMGAGEWRSADTWPLPGTEFMKFYLHSGGHANTRNGDGTLSTEPPNDEPADRFTYDPANPVPSVGGPICCISADDAPAGAMNQSEVELRNDVLVYTSAPLEEGVEVTGPLEAILYVSSDAKDTDFTVKLVDVQPDGTAYNVQEGILRARFREGFDRVVLIEEGEVERLRIDLHATGIWFGPGHRVRVEVSSSNFPRFDRNMNTGGNNYDESEWVVAHNAVHHTVERPSHVILPLVRRVR
ncbi:MAG: CocE/NonD family hydrolase [Gemmatimonadota bacterium]|nr:MAG: CocE/NonD family hydrolase [Gemmatimonadota bacterium]